MGYRILLIMPRFYGMELKTKAALESQGHVVVWIENKSLVFDYHGTNSKFKVPRRIYSWLFTPRVNFLKKQLKSIENLKFDILFAFNGFIICSFLFNLLKRYNPELRSVIFLWDSSRMFSWSRETKLFDRVVTFDQADAQSFGLEYCPNYYIKDKEELINRSGYDLFFAGKFSTERLNMLDKIIDQVSVCNCNLYLKMLIGYRKLLHCKVLYRFLKLTGLMTPWAKDYVANYEVVEGISKRDFFIREEIGFELLQSEMSLANVILDLSFKGQSGYSHRLIKALASGKKVITNNRNIIKEQFYNKDQVMIIDEDNPIIDYNWIKERRHFEINKYFEGLELSEWLRNFIK
ncbi:MAG TPA: hypothetical protein VJ963_11580 [Bacteroidales bacterium]|nr:hypothetical protein [Bacteroidales bacterium]